MNILDNELVKKYFGCHCPPEQSTLAGYHPENCTDKAIALRLLTAMQTPIKIRERYLAFEKNGECRESRLYEWGELYHPFNLRLPDKFQTPYLPDQVSKKIMTAKGFVYGHSFMNLKDITKDLEEWATELARIAISSTRE